LRGLNNELRATLPGFPRPLVALAVEIMEQ
jgi:hypothetical protein